ncbi:hypothetical protein OG225_13520 [Nocardia sp. NBC_01377]|uniref:hypothetical protein n=1 Tax=Nocardia sp. NBC_01377 TaxID=2903595 RepID=UPI00324A3A52
MSGKHVILNVNVLDLGISPVAWQLSGLPKDAVVCGDYFGNDSESVRYTHARSCPHTRERGVGPSCFRSERNSRPDRRLGPTPSDPV